MKPQPVSDWERQLIVGFGAFLGHKGQVCSVVAQSGDGKENIPRQSSAKLGEPYYSRYQLRLGFSIQQA